MTGLIIVAVFLIIFGFGRKAAKAKVDPNNPSPRMQKLLEKMAQQSGVQAPMQGQFTQPMSGQPLPGQTFPGAPPTQVQRTGRAQSSAQLGGMLQSLLQAGQQQHGYAQPGQYQPAPQQAPQPTNWPPQYQQAPPNQPAPQFQYAPQASRTQHGRQPEHNFPAPNSPLEHRIRELMSTGHEVPAIRLLCDEQDLGIIEAQKYARDLVAPVGKKGSATERVEEESRYVGSAAFAESPFDLDREESVWASGWVDKPEPEDRTDIDELWQTVKNAGRPATPPS